jgi:hypothetical protein
MTELDQVKLRELAQELGFWPASTKPEDVERHRRLNKALDAALDLDQLARKYAHLRKAGRA